MPTVHPAVAQCQHEGGVGAEPGDEERCPGGLCQMQGLGEFVPVGEAADLDLGKASQDFGAARDREVVDRPPLLLELEARLVQSGGRAPLMGDELER